MIELSYLRLCIFYSFSKTKTPLYICNVNADRLVAMEWCDTVVIGILVTRNTTQNV